MTTLRQTRDYVAHRGYWAVSLTHLLVDAINSGRSLVMALLAVTLGLSNQQVGLALIVYNIGSALAQPFFGLLSDRIGGRVLVIGGIGWMVVFASLAALLPPWPALVALTLAGVGSGAFHPAGTAYASQTSATHLSQATALFFVFGMVGLFLGPIISGIALDGMGRPGYIVVALISLAGVVLSWQWMDNVAPAVATATSRASSTLARLPLRPWQAGPLLIVIIAYSSIGITIMTYLPLVFTQRGDSIDTAGYVVGIYLLGAALGNFTGGALDDKLQRPRLLVALGLALTTPPMLLAITAPVLAQALLLAVAGFCGALPHSILVVLVQRIFPKQQGLASGLALGGMFFLGSVASFFIGGLGDQIGLVTALQWAAIIPALGAVFVFVLPQPPGRG